ncbi:GPI-anchored protein LORELEI [Raphanus sativus]|nr:GPI-anchored protein LORELEI [Raphanus sativus]KAJ4872968.1 GPI-anchored protein LORELEI [Raphanus sativus]
MEAKLFFLLMALLVTRSSSSPITNSVFESQTSVSGRNLLSVKKLDFESKNYTDLTRQCKGPKYPAKECCAAFKQFACPYAHQINDLTTDCARIMFSYITVHGKYPPGLFATECRETKEGLVCPSSPPRVSAAPHHITLVVSAATALLAFLVLA